MIEVVVVEGPPPRQYVSAHSPLSFAAKHVERVVLVLVVVMVVLGMAAAVVFVLAMVVVADHMLVSSF